VTDNNEVLDLFSDTRHRGNSSILSASVSNSKTILRVNPSAKWSDVVAGRVKLCHQPTSLPLHNIPTIINGQVLPLDKSVPKYKIRKLVSKTSAIDSHPKEHKILLLSDSHGRGCSKRIKNQLLSNFEVCGFVKPGVSSSILTNTSSTEINKLTQKDFIVLWSWSTLVCFDSLTLKLKALQTFEILSATRTQLTSRETQVFINTAVVIYNHVVLLNWLLVTIFRKDTNLQNLGAAETKLLYTLHWIILDAAEECADADYEKGICHASPFYYLFSIPAISVSAHCAVISCPLIS
jgi:hypothetical protein